MTTTDPAVVVARPVGLRRAVVERLGPHLDGYDLTIDICRKNGTQWTPRHRAEYMDRSDAIALLEEYVGDERLSDDGPRRALAAARIIAGDDKRAHRQLDAAAAALDLQAVTS